MTKKVVPIKYTSRNFNSIKQDLLNYTKKYYPDTYKDFNEASFGSLMLDSVAYVGDVLSYYVDYQANECFLDTAIEYNNIVKIGNQFGYKESGAPVSTGFVTIYFQLPANIDGTAPNFEYLPTIKRGTTFSTIDRKVFTLAEDIVINQNTAEVISAKFNENAPLSWAVKTYGKVISGIEDTQFYDVGAFKKFPVVPLNSLDITEIISVTDSQGNEYYEVENLTQNVIYKSLPNLGEDRLQTPNILKPVTVTRRFTVQKSGRFTFLQFGGASETTLDDKNTRMADPSEVTLKMYGRDYVTDGYFDPSKLLNNDKMGLAPENTRLTIVYRRNTSINSNAPAYSINSVQNLLTAYTNEFNLDSLLIYSINKSFEVENPEPVIGATNDFSSDELKTKITDSFSAQSRAVTENDYRALCYLMPANYGKIKRAKIIRDVDELRRNINIYIISENQSGELIQANDSLKTNLKNWLNKNRMINDTIDILDAKIVNYGIDFSILTDLNVPKYKVLSAAIQKLKNDFSYKLDIGEPLMITSIYDSLKKVDGIVDVRNVKISLKTGVSSASGNSYSSYSFDFNKFLSPDGRFLSVPKNVILELKYPDFDIQGKIV